MAGSGVFHQLKMMTLIILDVEAKVIQMSDVICLFCLVMLDQVPSKRISSRHSHFEKIG